MKTINKKILDLQNKIIVLETKIKDLTENNQEKTPPPNTKTRTSKGKGWWFIQGKWCTYSIYAD